MLVSKGAAQRGRRCQTRWQGSSATKAARCRRDPRRNNALGGSGQSRSRSGGKAAAQQGRLSAVAIAIQRQGGMLMSKVAAQREGAVILVVDKGTDRRRNSTLGGPEQSRSQSGGEAAAQRGGAVQPWALAGG